MYTVSLQNVDVKWHKKEMVLYQECTYSTAVNVSYIPTLNEFDAPVAKSVLNLNVYDLFLFTS